MASPSKHSTAVAVQNLNLAARSFGLGVRHGLDSRSAGHGRLFRAQQGLALQPYCRRLAAGGDDTRAQNGWQESNADGLAARH